MDRLWFHQCIQGFLSLAAIRTRDVHQFVDIHPYQSNIRLIEAQQNALNQQQEVTIKSAFHLPDRSVLYHKAKNKQTSSGREGISRTTSEQELTLAANQPPPSLVDVKLDQPSGYLLKLLPVYVRPQEDVVTEDEDSETGWKHLEERLQEESPGDETQEVPIMNSDDVVPPQPPPPGGLSIFDRFDAHIDASHFGIPESRTDEGHREFVSWLTNLEGFGVERELDSKKKKKEAKNSGKRKNKAKKEAKRLAKQSVQKKRVVATETLAELLTRQGHHQDAIEMYERLCLIYPEKKSIFAARIETIKSLHP